MGRLKLLRKGLQPLQTADYGEGARMQVLRYHKPTKLSDLDLGLQFYITISPRLYFSVLV